MEKMLIHGGKKLTGEVVIGGAKNSTVALIPAAILSRTPVTLDSVPHIQDVYNLMAILGEMNVDSDFTGNILKIDPTQIKKVDLPSGKIKSMRASYYFMGAMLGRFGHAVIGLPGGDDIGPRPIDQHVKGFEALGATVVDHNGIFEINAPKEGLHGARIHLDMASVGATNNIILAAVTASGQTVIENAAREPEIIDLATFLNNMGAVIRGAGTDTLLITGVPELRAHNVHTIIPDRIEAGTYLSLAATMGEGILIKNIIAEHLDSFLAKLEEVGVMMDVNEDSIFVYPSGELRGVTLQTDTYPGIATDLQQPVTPLLLAAEGESHVIDVIYPKRTRHVDELIKMGANISVGDGQINIAHSDNLHGANVVAEEIRGGACLMVAGLMANGETVISKVDNILRGYDRVVMKLRSLGADVEIVDLPD
ncbi:UDP-N-acetylglucosamine 1-carboxyvinyltransferase [Lacticaseibacillus pabuli]|uniref:UDP-N-acetylglucosamine 1-carboxyvinyltransferase n=1 Tax=Lacticaseibacillus pabuli TaxID=3025672 RepID=A0ABY7WVH5_9LACO|nr:UDP-N-acetylglucosamine 1-carboxyvinyltransferase [Lacticaseibacillus sp. KACC 23028]WDF83064.1 UDP-N-acetylglucosamine 1-carboxyvinyltransferase [Lacticaseibacillus sp. KACC 23028]